MKINFTSENEKQLKDLFLDLGFSGLTLNGKFGANSYNAYQLLHNCTIETLQGLFTQTNKEINALGETNRWTSTTATQDKVKRLTKWKEYLDLLIGYKFFTAEVAAETSRKRKEAQEKLILLKGAKDAAEIKRISELDPEKLDAEIAAVEAAIEK